MPEANDEFSTILAVLTGLGLAAACGFRVFLPLFVASLAARSGYLRLQEDFAWLGSSFATICFGAATLIEIGGFLLPFLDNLLDVIATPAAAVAGAVVSLAVFVDLDPGLRWTLALVAGAGLATAVQVPTAAARGGSSALTGGIANWALAVGELFASGLLALLSLLAPIAVPLVLIALIFVVIRLARRRKNPPGSLSSRA